jgi:hypothetical protein
VQYFLGKFLAQNHQKNKDIYHHVTCAFVRSAVRRRDAPPPPSTNRCRPRVVRRSSVANRVARRPPTLRRRRRRHCESPANPLPP